MERITESFWKAQMRASSGDDFCVLTYSRNCEVFKFEAPPGGIAWKMLSALQMFCDVDSVDPESNDNSKHFCIVCKSKIENNITIKNEEDGSIINPCLCDECFSSFIPFVHRFCKVNQFKENI